MRHHTSQPPCTRMMGRTEFVLPSCAKWWYDQEVGPASELGSAPHIESEPKPKPTAAERAALIATAAAAAAARAAAATAVQGIPPLQGRQRLQGPLQLRLQDRLLGKRKPHPRKSLPESLLQVPALLALRSQGRWCQGPLAWTKVC